MDIRKKKRVFKPSLFFVHHHFSLNSLVLCFSFLLLFLFLFHDFRTGSSEFQPARIVPNLSLFSSSISDSIHDFTRQHRGGVRGVSGGGGDSRNHGLAAELKIEDWVLFTEHVLVILSANGKRPVIPHLGDRIDCVYTKLWNESSGGREKREKDETQAYPMLSVDEYHNGRWIVRCPLPPANYSAAVGLKGHRSELAGFEFDWTIRKEKKQSIPSWDMIAYDSVWDKEETAVVFVKGLNLRADKESDPTQFSCHFNMKSSGEKYVDSKLTTKAITAAQEVIRCPVPQDLRTNLKENEGVQITIEMTSHVQERPQGRSILRQLAPSIAKLYHTKNNKGKYKYDLCACTMVWNQAAIIREWITYHAWLGIQRWFIYDNNSNDGLKQVINELDSANYNVTMHAWPWVKSQEAGFAHCMLRAREQCTWVAFFDVDEFYYFPPPTQRHGASNRRHPGPNWLRGVVGNISFSSPSVAEIRTDCHNFGPSGLKKSPARGVTLGYTCRLRTPERHKSIIRPDAVDDSLLNQVHHFKLKKGFIHKTLPLSMTVINHYKYQVWDVFKAKFYRRVSTYVADWQENQNENSRDRAPGLGTEAIEPPNWNLKFCEVWDTRLRDFVLASLANPTTGLLPWERSIQ